MKEYGRCAWSYIKDLLLTVLATAVAYGAVWLLLRYVPLGLERGAAMLLLYGVPALVCLGMLYLALVADAVRLTLRRDGQVSYHRAGAKARTWDARNAYFDWVNRSQTSGNTTPHDITLRITELNGEVAEVDCSPLGRRRFAQFMQDVKGYALWRRPGDIPPRPAGEAILPTGAPLPGQMGALLAAVAVQPPLEKPAKAKPSRKVELEPEPEFQVGGVWEPQEPFEYPPLAEPLEEAAPESVPELVPGFETEPENPPKGEPVQEPELEQEPESPPMAEPEPVQAPEPEPQPEAAPEPQPEAAPEPQPTVAQEPEPPAALPPEPERAPEPPPAEATRQFVRPILPGDPPAAPPADAIQEPPQRTQEFAVPQSEAPVKPILPGDPLPEGDYDVPPPPPPPLIKRRDAEEAAPTAQPDAEPPAEEAPPVPDALALERGEGEGEAESSVVQFAAETLLQEEEKAYWQALQTGEFQAQAAPQRPKDTADLQDELQKMLERLTGEIPIIKPEEDAPSPALADGAEKQREVPPAPLEIRAQAPQGALPPEAKRKIRWRRKKSDD